MLPVDPVARKQALAAQQRLGLEGGGSSDHLALVKVSNHTSLVCTSSNHTASAPSGVSQVGHEAS